MKPYDWPSWKNTDLAGPPAGGVRRSGTRLRVPEPLDEIPCATFEEVVQRHGCFIMGEIVSCLTSDAGRSLRDDVFQEVLVKVDRRHRTPEGLPHPLRRHLVELVRNEVRSQTRSDARRRIAGELDEEATPASRPDPEQLYAQREEEARRRETMVATFQEMRPESAAMVRRVHVDGRSYEEVARELGCSVPAVTDRLHRAREQFCKIFRRLWRAP